MALPKMIAFVREIDENRDTKSAEESQDELQAINTALCFLCSINADAKEVDNFLTLYPEALLLEGAGNLEEESARYIVEEQMRRCECFSPACCQNRLKILDALSNSFEHYQNKTYFIADGEDCKYHVNKGIKEDPRWEQVSDSLLAVERDIRQWRHAELQMRNKLLEKAVEVRTYLDELEQMGRYHSRSSVSSDTHKSSFASLLALPFTQCTVSRSGASDRFARRNILEYKVKIASLKLVDWVPRELMGSRSAHQLTFRTGLQ